ncbi:MAG: hypothetical protein ACKPKO_48990, partial [Candidatus Fonsibacter sp.]
MLQSSGLGGTEDEALGLPAAFSVEGIADALGYDATAVRFFLLRHGTSDVSDDAKAKCRDGELFGKSPTLDDVAGGTVACFNTSPPLKRDAGAT